MSRKEGYSRKGLFGEIKHYDANGRKVGESRPNILGGMMTKAIKQVIATRVF